MKTVGTTILIGDVREQLRTLEPGSVHCAITSPPYWGLRAYGTDPQVWGGDPACEHSWQDASWSNNRWGAHDDDNPGTKQRTNRGSLGHRGEAKSQAVCTKCNAWLGELGSEPTPELFVQNLLEVFQSVRRVLRDDGVLFVNIGDSYCAAPSGGIGVASTLTGSLEGQLQYRRARRHRASFRRDRVTTGSISHIAAPGLKPKDLCLIPARLAIALQADGWYVRSDIPWLKRNPMPESTEDRPAKALEYIFMLTKSERYYFDMQAVKKVASGTSGGASFGAQTKNNGANGAQVQSRKLAGKEERAKYDQTRNFRNADLWFESLAEPHGLCCLDDELVGLDVPTESFPGAHFATFPKRLVEPLIKAATSERGCCPTCGAPWNRVIETFDTGKTQKMADGWDTGEGGHGTVHRNGREKGEAGKPVLASLTIGWQASCDHNAGEPVPSLVLDCFGGSGTVGLVSNALGRDAILIELNPDYAEMARQRIARGYAPESSIPPAPGQKELFT